MMRHAATLPLVCLLMLARSATGLAQDHAPIHALSKADDARWIAVVRDHRTRDGSTVAEVLAYAERMRPKHFKAGSFEAGYNGATGRPEAVAIGYWLGTQRTPGDSYVDLGYEMTPDGTVRPV